MPTPDLNVSASPALIDIAQSSGACPPLTPPPEAHDYQDAVSSQHRHVGIPQQEPLLSEHRFMNNNTGAGMAQEQEDSMYLSPVATPVMSTGEALVTSDDNERMELAQEEHMAAKAIHSIEETVNVQTDGLTHIPVSPQSPCSSYGSDDHEPASNPDINMTEDRDRTSSDRSRDPTNHTECRSEITRQNERTPSEHTSRYEPLQSGIPKIDRELNWDSLTPAHDFTKRRPNPRHPSSLFQYDSKYVGTQQSDRQTYNVNVRILTIDIEQCTCTGYLLIEGLTPEHDTLQTYFTGEIIGGPNQKYSFRTKTPEWGANDKTDMTHWQRFSAWRPHAAQAKRDLDFRWPANGENWADQEHVFMRWKEHFLVPDHNTRQIAGASFEGFYYICLNQVEGRISGIYFHSRSEKYQQLELKHEGEPGIWHRGVTPCVEFR